MTPSKGQGPRGPTGPKNRSDGATAGRPAVGDSPRFAPGDEVWIARRHPLRLAGQYATVREISGGWARVEVAGDRRLYWYPAATLAPAYGAEL
jgi:hypothetical protein